MPTLRANGYRGLELLLLLGLAGAGCSPTKVPATVVLLTDLSGTTEPCGCTSRPLGGLGHIAGMVEALRQRQGSKNVALAVSGSTFYSVGDSNGAMRVQESRKAEVIADVFERLHPAAINPGATDRGAMRTELETQLRPRPLPMLWRENYQSTFNLGGVNVALLGVPPYADLSFVNDLAAGARRQGAQFVVALISDTHALRTLSAQGSLAALQGVNVLVQAGLPGPTAPEVVGSTAVVNAGSKGEHLGLLRLRPGKSGRDWTYFDGNKAERAALQARHRRLQQEAEALPEGEAKAARLRKADEVMHKLKAPPPAAPKGATFAFEVADVDGETPVAEWAQKRLQAYQRALCAPLMAESAKRTCPQVGDASLRYVGTPACLGCHAGTLPVYHKTSHARAWATLTQAGKDCDLGCIGCHTVGYEQPGGYCHLADASKFANVGCESCHGPGGGHVDHPGERTRWGKMSRTVSEATCRTCHTPEHSDRFDYPSYLSKVLGPGHNALQPPAP